MRQLLIAITFLTTIPLPIPKNISPQEQGQSTALFPIVGLLLGGILVGIDQIVSIVWNWKSVGRNTILVTSMVFLTGGLHLDGLMDTCDGIFSRRSKERMLEIMKDSHVGAFGVIGAICILSLKLAFLNEIEADQRWRALVTAPILGRWAMSCAIALFPYARQSEGMGYPFKNYTSRKFLLYATLIAFLSCVSVLGMPKVLAAMLTMGFAVLIAQRISGKLGGLTGDTYGAICEITETVALIAISY